MLSSVEILKAARNKISKPGTWTQGAAARNRENRNVASFSPNAVCWCMMGAVESIREADYGDKTPVYDALCGALSVNRSIGVVNFNDAPGRTQEEVLAVMDRAIKSLEEEKCSPSQSSPLQSSAPSVSSDT